MIKVVKQSMMAVLFLVLIALLLLVNGCGKIKEEVIREEETLYSERTRREPYPILRDYTNQNGYIEFTDTTGGIELKRIYYNNYDPITTVGQEDCITLYVPTSHNGDNVTIQVRGKVYEWQVYDNNSHNVVFNIKAGTEFPDFRYLGLFGDVLSADNEYDFVRVFVNNVLMEMYYISDFE